MKQSKAATAGELRQIKQQGASDSGFYSHAAFGAQLPAMVGLYFYKKEPGGIFMDTLEKTRKQIEDSTDAIAASGRKLVEVAKDANKQMAEVAGKFREGSDHLAHAINKMMALADRHDFAKRVNLTKTLVESLERLAALEKQGTLDKVLAALDTIQVRRA